MSIGGGGGGGSSGPTEQEKVLAETGAKKFNDFVNRFLDLKDPIVEDVTDKATPRRDLGAQVRANAMEDAGLDGDTMVDRISQGQSQATGQTKGDLLDRVSGARRGTAAGRGEIEPGLEERKVKGLLKMASVGRGLQDNASLSLSNSAKRAESAAAREQERDAESDAAFANSVGGLAGAGVSAYRNYNSGGNSNAWNFDPAATGGTDAVANFSPIGR